MPSKKVDKSVVDTTGTEPATIPPDIPSIEKESDDLLTVLFLFLVALSLSYLFIRYLLRKRQNLKKTSGWGGVRRYRFGRIRKSFQYKPWLEPLDPLESLDPADSSFPTANLEDTTANAADLYEDEIVEDADQLIQSNISREFVRNQLDPFALKPSSKNILRNWDLGDLLGIGLAAGCAILFIFILSSIEE